MLTDTVSRPCDLCGGQAFDTLLDLPDRAMLSDWRAVEHRLFKQRCRQCGLVRGDVAAAPEIATFYRDHYQQFGQGDHVFFTRGGPRARADVIAEWLTAPPRGALWDRAPLVVEIGCGNGATLAAVAARVPQRTLEGIEPNRAAAEQARRRGLHVTNGSPSDLPPGHAEGLFAFAVLEHVESPRAFIQDLRRLLNEGGWLMLAQPTQDVPSSDLFFLDHLHHFGSPHVSHYAASGGFRELGAEVGHPLMPNFSLHWWRAVGEPTASREWNAPAVETASARSITTMLGDFARLDRLLIDLNQRGRRIAAFGLAEAFALLNAYTMLSSTPLVCGLADPPFPPDLRLPIGRPEEAIERFGVEDVLLTMNRVHYPLAKARFTGVNVTVHEIFSV